MLNRILELRDKGLERLISGVKNPMGYMLFLFTWANKCFEADFDGFGSFHS